MMAAIADRYYGIDCSCFSPNIERRENLVGVVEEYGVQGVVQNILQYCHTYNVEAKAIENRLNEIDIPSIKIETDYSEEDTGQIRTRLEAFAEMIPEV
jgi:benzoyl-CoA reductase/2-hydroxyglutaryl-CoA dehydratase subunit BcrC/BadD/HgdB